eukprot:PhF_6_TR42193/c1_g1_i1/m.63851
MELHKELSQMRTKLVALSQAYNMTMPEILQEYVLFTQQEVTIATRARTLADTSDRGDDEQNSEERRFSVLSETQIQNYAKITRTDLIPENSVRVDQLIESVHFGVEVETILQKRSNEVLMDNVAKALRDVVPAMNQYCGDTIKFKYFAYDAAKADRDYNVWKVTTDLSIKSEDGRPIFGLEFVTPKLIGAAGLHDVQVAMEGMHRLGFATNNTTALHVHVSCQNLTNEHLRAFSMHCVLFESVIDLFMTVPRRGDYSRYCRSNLRSVAPSRSMQAALDSLRQLDLRKSITPLVKLMCPQLSTVTNSGRNHKVNFLLLADTVFGQPGRRVEFRQHQGTTDAVEISNWVKLLIKFLHTTAKRPIEGLHDGVGTMENFWKIINDTDLQLYYTVKAESMPTNVQFTYETREYFESPEDDIAPAQDPPDRSPQPVQPITPQPQPQPRGESPSTHRPTPPAPRPPQGVPSTGRTVSPQAVTNNNTVSSPATPFTTPAVTTTTTSTTSTSNGGGLTASPRDPTPKVTPTTNGNTNTNNNNVIVAQPSTLPTEGPIQKPLVVPVIVELKVQIPRTCSVGDVEKVVKKVTSGAQTQIQDVVVMGNLLSTKRVEWVLAASQDQSNTIIAVSPALFSHESLELTSAVTMALGSVGMNCSVLAHVLCPHAQNSVFLSLCLVLMRYEDIWASITPGISDGVVKTNSSSVRLSLRHMDQMSTAKIMAAVERLDVSMGLEELRVMTMAPPTIPPEEFALQVHHAAVSMPGRRGRRVVFRSECHENLMDMKHWLWLCSVLVTRMLSLSSQDVTKVLNATTGNAERAFFEKIVASGKLAEYYRNRGGRGADV